MYFWQYTFSFPRVWQGIDKHRKLLVQKSLCHWSLIIVACVCFNRLWYDASFLCANLTTCFSLLLLTAFRVSNDLSVLALQLVLQLFRLGAIVCPRWRYTVVIQSQSVFLRCSSCAFVGASCFSEILKVFSSETLWRDFYVLLSGVPYNLSWLLSVHRALLFNEPFVLPSFRTPVACVTVSLFVQTWLTLVGSRSQHSSLPLFTICCRRQTMKRMAATGKKWLSVCNGNADVRADKYISLKTEHRKRRKRSSFLFLYSNFKFFFIVSIQERSSVSFAISFERIASVFCLAVFFAVRVCNVHPLLWYALLLVL